MTTKGQNPYKTVTFRADAAMNLTLEMLRKELSQELGVNVSLSDVLRLAVIKFSDDRILERRKENENG